MTRIDFHSGVADKVAYACRVLRKASADGWQTVAYCEDDAQLHMLDQVLWTFSEQDFLPHVIATDPLAGHTPIVLTTSDEVPLPHHRLLINLSLRSPAHFARFERLVEIVSQAEPEVTAGRERYNYYRQRGYQLNHYKQG